jgi:capsular exopolysaccharide synthesis family protein
MQPDQLRKLARKWTIPILVLTIIGAGAAYFISHRLTPMYEAKGSLLVVAGPGQAGSASSLNINATQATTTAATLLTEPPLLQQVINQLHLDLGTDALAKEVAATPQNNTELVDVVVRDASPVRAAQIANSLMNDYVTQVTNQNTQRINQAGAALQAQIDGAQATLRQEEQQLATSQRSGQDTTALRSAVAADSALLSQLNLNFSSFKIAQAQNLETVTVAALASPPTAPASPSTLLNTVIGAIIGLLVALGVVALVQFLDQGLNNAEDVRQRLGLPCLAVVPRYRGLPTVGKRRGRRKERSAESAMEAYRRLRTNLLFSSPDAELKSIAITSVRAGEGKTSTAANLAVALANSEKRVLLIDADLRKPDQHRLFNKSLDGGFTELIVSQFAGAPSLNGVYTTDFANLSLITCGTIPPNPAELLASKRAHVLLRALAEQRDVIVIDTPPAGVVTDPLSLAADASATILVVEVGKTNAAEASNVIDALRGVGANVVGVVLNKAPKRRGRGYSYTYGYSGYGTGQQAAVVDATPQPAEHRTGAPG